MLGKRVSIAQVMMLVALAATNLAIARASPWEIVIYPTLWVTLGILDFLIVGKLILRREFRAFHYTFLIVLLVSFIVFANLVASERVHPLGPLIRWYQHLSNDPTNLRSIAGFIFLAEIWSTAFLSTALAIAVGLLAAQARAAPGWDIAAFWRGR